MNSPSNADAPAKQLTIGEASIEALIASLLDAGTASLHTSARAMGDPVTRRDPEIVHQARVSVRRMRSALRVFEGTLEERVPATVLRRAQKALQRLARALGAARDWDVIQSQLLPARRALLAQALGRESLLRTARRAQLARVRANNGARRFVAGDQFAALLARVADLRAELVNLLSARNDANRVVRALERQTARVKRLGAKLARLDDRQRHRLRIEAKRLRYAVELCAPLFAKEDSKRWLRPLRGLQEALGEINDARVLLEHLAPAGEDDKLRGQLAELATHAALKRLPQAAAFLMAWRLARPPWKT